MVLSIHAWFSDSRTPCWWGGWGSNPRPKDYESSALTD